MSLERPLPAAHNPRSVFSLVVGIVGLAGVVALFLPYWGRSLLGQLKLLWRPLLSVLLAIPVSALTARWVVSGTSSRAERLVAYLTASFVACSSLFMFLALFARWPGPAGFVVPHVGVGLAASAGLLALNWWRGVPSTVNAIVAMQMAYVFSAPFILLSTVERRAGVGRDFVAVTTLAYIVQIVAVSVAALRHRTGLKADKSPRAVVVLAVVFGVIIVVGIVSAIAIPGLMRARIAGNETSCLATMRAIYAAQQTYALSNQGFYDSRLECLAAPAQCIPSYSGTGFLASTVGPVSSGYAWAMYPAQVFEPNKVPSGFSPSSRNGFVAVAAPVTLGTTGFRTFCLDSSGKICAMPGSNLEFLVQQLESEPWIRCSSACVPVR